MFKDDASSEPTREAVAIASIVGSPLQRLCATLDGIKLQDSDQRPVLRTSEAPRH